METIDIFLDADLTQYLLFVDRYASAMEAAQGCLEAKPIVIKWIAFLYNLKRAFDSMKPN